jgi:Ca2+-transporting ATPase
MPQQNGSGGMGYGQPKRSARVPPVALSTSSNYRFSNPRSATGYRQQQRSPSPPASAYFPLLQDDVHPRFQATPDADAHFAYSTTLRRHHVDGAALSTPKGLAAAVNAEASSLWSRVINFISGRTTNDYQPLENGSDTPPVQRPESEGTLSAKFAHCSVEVCTGVTLFTAHVNSRLGHNRLFPNVRH